MAEPLQLPGLGPQRVYRNFAGGVNTALEPDLLPKEVSPWGRNAVLAHVSGGAAVPERRLGFRPLNQTPLVGSILKLVGFNYLDPDDGSIEPHLISVSGSSSTSSVDLVDQVDGTITNIGTAVFSSEEAIPSTTVAQNCVFFSNGTAADRQKLLYVSGSLALQPWGMDPPASAVVTPTGSGSMDGEYEVALSLRNESSGAVSSRGASTTATTSGGQTLVVDWSGLSLPAQATHVKIHVRKTGLNAQFFEIDDEAVASGSVTLDASDADLNQLILLSPSETEYGRPPSTTKGSAWHLSRMFVFDDTNIYWSALGAPEQFNPVDYQPVNPKDGGRIVTILQVHDSLLLILKSNAVWGLYGTSPDDWELRVINPGIGCRAQHSAHVLDGKVVWWAEDGPVLWTQESPPVPIGKDLLGDRTSDLSVDPQHLDQLTSCLDVRNHRVLWSVTETGNSQNSIIFPFNIRLGVWESHAWDPFEVSALGTCLDVAGVTWIYAGNPYGRLFEYGSSPTDGARVLSPGYFLTDEDLELLQDENDEYLFDDSDPWADAVTLTVAGSPTTADTTTTLVDSSAVFDIEGAGLTGLFVYLIDSATRQVQRRRILSNTQTVLTVQPAWSEPPALTDEYVIGVPMFEWDTRWEDWDEPFIKKRFTRLYAQASMEAPGSIDLDFDIMTRLDAGTIRKTLTLTGSGASAYWDISYWDADGAGTVTYFERETVEELRAWIGNTGRSLRVRVRYYEPIVPITLLKIGMEAIVASGRR